MGKSSKQKNAVRSEAKALKQEANVPVVEKDVASEHLPPLGLVFTVIACSGFLFMFSFRDVFATGRNIAGDIDEAYLQFTKSTDFFDDTNGWKSTQGGLSSIMPKTTDANNMGAIFANLALAAFYGSALEDFTAASANSLPMIFIAVLLFESTVIFGYLATSKQTQRGPAKAMTDGKTPSSIPSRIVARSVLFCSGAVALIAGRDLFFPGEILDFIPRDDIYLEWTNAFLHSPPVGTVEADENGLAADLFSGDKFLSQLLGLNLLLLTVYKFVSGFLIRYGSDGSGEVKARMMWKSQFVGNAIVLWLFRLFTSSAKSASLDLQWHLMFIAYETGILAIYGLM